jgi:hypothetical protein
VRDHLLARCGSALPQITGMAGGALSIEGWIGVAALPPSAGPVQGTESSYRALSTQSACWILKRASPPRPRAQRAPGRTIGWDRVNERASFKLCRQTFAKNPGIVPFLTPGAPEAEGNRNGRLRNGNPATVLTPADEVRSVALRRSLFRGVAASIRKKLRAASAARLPYQ